MKVKNTFTLMIERKYTHSETSSWWPAFEVDTEEESQELLETFPPIYGEVSRMIVSSKPSVNESESWLRKVGG